MKLSVTERSVSLDRGEAYFEVAKDAARPFFVDARSAAVRVVGTRFDVLSNGTLTEITPIDAGEAAAWREGRLVYDGVPLSEVVADLARYRSAVTLKSAAAGELRVTADCRNNHHRHHLNRFHDRGCLPAAPKRQKP